MDAELTNLPWFQDDIFWLNPMSQNWKYFPLVITRSMTSIWAFLFPLVFLFFLMLIILPTTDDMAMTFRTLINTNSATLGKSAWMRMLSTSRQCIHAILSGYAIKRPAYNVDRYLEEQSLPRLSIMETRRVTELNATMGPQSQLFISVLKTVMVRLWDLLDK